MMDSNISNIAQSAGTVHCPECNRELHCYDTNHSIFFGCTNCAAFFKKNEAGSFVTLERNFGSLVYDFTLPIGVTGHVKEKTFTIVGMVQKRDIDDEGMVWNEYMLYCQGTQNYFTLAETNGDWVVVWPGELIDYNIINIGTVYNPRNEIRQKGTFRKYTLYASYRFDILGARGEFDWNVLAEVRVKGVSEYTDLPDMIVGERIEDDLKWYFGHTIDRQEIGTAFGISMEKLLLLKRYPDPKDPEYMKKWPVTKKFTLYALGVALLVLFLGGIFKPAREAYSAQFVVSKDTASASWGSTNTIVTDTFEIRSAGAVSINLYAPLENEWLEVTMELVNNKTGKTYELARALEYYSGYEGGESWSEGDRDDKSVISRVPAGIYHLNISPYFETQRQADVSVKVEENTGLTSNTVMMFIALLVWPVIQFLLKNGYDGDE